MCGRLGRGQARGALQLTPNVKRNSDWVGLLVREREQPSERQVGARRDLEFSLYADWARRDYVRLQRWRDAQARFIDGDTVRPRDGAKYARCAAHIENLSISVVVFSAMALEGYLYDYAASFLGDSFVDAHLDRLDMTSKWVLIPRLVAGYEVPREGETYPLVKRLQRRRHALVHRKSRGLPPSDPDVTEAWNKARIVERRERISLWPGEAIAALDCVARDLDSHHSESMALFWLSHPDAP